MYRMQRFVLSALFLFLLSSFAFTQEGQDESLPPPSHSAAKFGGAIGFAPSVLSMNLNSLNALLTKSNAQPFSGSSLFMTGGQAYGYILFVQNLRGGIMWGSGSMNSLSAIGSTTRNVELHLNFTGATIEYVIPVSARFDLTLGTMIGGGSMDITTWKDDGQPKVWDSLWTSFGSSQGTASSYSRKLSGTFFMYEPTANVEFALLRWLGLRAGVGYLGMTGSSWKLDGKYDIIGVPDDINGKGLMFNAGIFFGTFIF